ncbi:MAG: zinc metalloprotease, partial [Rubricoccaceae bacterium]|nr:zinc metalloprotease [Rubricoccaceae bacterium]
MFTPSRLRWAGCALVLLLAAAPALRAQDIAPPEHRTCATPEPTEAEARQTYEAVQAWLAQHPAPRDGEVVTIPVAFHVIYSGGTGNVPEQQVIDQIDVLNDAFLPIGYRFVLAIVNRVENPDWFFGLTTGTQETQMKAALAVDPARFLNVYTAQLAGGLLGWAYFPNSFGEGAFLHGVVLHYASLPGGTLVPYNEGDTGTHEVGHYVGLFHTFQGGCSGGDTAPGCETGGDQVCDTPAEASPAFGCPGGRDTCPTGEDDPI